MNRILTNVSLVALSVSLIAMTPELLAQKPQGPPGAGPAGAPVGGAPGGGAASLSGFSYTPTEWKRFTNLPPAKKKVLCFKLRYGNSSSQPFILEPVENAQKFSTECTTVDSQDPLLMREILVIGIDWSEIVEDSRLKLLNINVTNQQGNPINATPIRPSFTSLPSATSNAGGAPIYLTWPYELPGDAIPTVSVSTVYTPVIPGAPWQSNTFYPAGSVVVSAYNNGHFYTALSGGVSGNTDPGFLAAAVPAITDGQLTWEDSGTTLPTGAKATMWLPATPHCLGDVIADPYNGHFYTVAVGGVPPSPPAVPTCATTSGPPPTDPFPSSPPPSPTGIQFSVSDGSVLWKLVVPPGTRRASAYYSVGQIVKDLASNNFYVVVATLAPVARTSASATNPFPATPPARFRVNDGDVTWELVGRWESNHPYANSSVVLDASGSHLYKSQANGTSGAIPSQPFFPIGQGGVFADRLTAVPVTESFIRGVNWIDMLTSNPAIAAWKPGTEYHAGQTVRDPNGAEIYQALNDGPSGSVFPEPPHKPPMLWEDTGQQGNGLIPEWTKDTDYSPNTLVRDPVNKEVYRAMNDGHSGPTLPNFVLTPAPHLQIQWQDSGTTPPASVASGQPADQTVSLLNLTLPQVHSLYYYNVAAEVIVSSIRIPNNVAIEVTPATSPATYTYKQQGSNLLIDPVLLFTAYIRPMDAERPFRVKEIFKIPGITFGLSLASPTTNFYFGGSTEVLRNIQCVYGFNVSNISKLAVPSGTVGVGSTAPTVQSFSKGGFIGFTFNISGFIQGLFGAGSKSPI